MRILIIGGTRFVGHFLTWRLIGAGHQVTLLNRGTMHDPFGDRVKRVIADRRALGAYKTIEGSFDATVDFAAYTAGDVRGLVDNLADRAGHYIFISTGQVYLVRENCPAPHKEEDYDGPVMPRPASEADLGDWEYGIGKRDAEDFLAAAWRELKFPSTRLRIPMVNGPRDNYRRIESYLWRILDGGPILMPENYRRPMRHVYSSAVVDAIVTILGRSDTFGEAYNLAQNDTPSLPEMIGLLSELCGAPNRAVPVENSRLLGAGLVIREVSPFSGKWMSSPDPSKAKTRLNFRHPPLRSYVEQTVTAFFAHHVTTPPPGYHGRALELSLA